ncbi:spore germination protein [Falsibacillus albus]|nr:spore germination protein [Falsibacillus albus]
MRRKTKKIRQKTSESNEVKKVPNFKMTIDENFEYVSNAIANTSELAKREIFFNNKKCYLIFLSTITSSETIENQIIKPLLEKKEGDVTQTVYVNEVKELDQLEDLPISLIIGAAILLIDGEMTAFSFGVSQSEKRSVTEPVNEQVIRGSHEGFVEDLRSNINMLRKRLNIINLKVTYYVLGSQSQLKLAIVYIDKLANQELIQEIDRRLSYIQVDYVDSPGQLEEFIEDSPFSPFPQLMNTERPDRVTAQLMEGRIALLCNGSPSALILPVTFFAFYQSPDDYNSRWYLGSFYRFVRLMSFFVAIGLPATYIAVVSFHYEVIPMDLVFTIKGSLEYVPIPPLVEAMFMQVILELIRESAIRLPAPIAQTIGVVGGLVIGTAVVQANLVSNTMIVVVALTAIASFVVPNSEMGTSVRILGFPLMLSAAFLGFIGMTFTFLIILIHLCKLESFGSPYFAPFAPFRAKDFKDTFTRVPLWLMNRRPSTPKPQRMERQLNPRGWKNENGK